MLSKPTSIAPSLPLMPSALNSSAHEQTVSLRPELFVLKLLLNKPAYTTYGDYVDRDYIKGNYRELNFLYETLDALHAKMDGSITVDEFSLAFSTKYPTADKQIYGSLLKTLQDAEISEEVGGYLLSQIKSKKAALKLSETAFKVAQGILPKDDLIELMDDWDEDPDIRELPLKQINLYEALDNAYKDRGLRWRLDCLNKSLGSLRAGDFGFIFARPETGKTTFLASEVTGFTDGNDSVVCWFNNEEDGNKVGVRIIQAHFGITLETYTARKGYYHDRLRETLGDRLHLFDEGQLNKRDVEAIIKEIQPDLVIYDQIDKIRGFTSDRDDLRLGAIYQWARELAKGNHSAIGVCQADGHAEGVRYLTMEHVANAKTSKQAEADFIIGIGTQHSEGQEFIRYLNISKNKLFGDEDSIADLRHGRFEVLIEPQIARYRDIIKFE